MYTVISTHDIRKQYTAVSILLGLINNVHPDLHERQTETIDRCYNLIFLINNVYRHLHAWPYGNYRQMLQSYYVSSTMYTVISTARHTETLDSCFNLMRSHQQCIPWSPHTTYGNNRKMLQSYYCLINNVYRHLHARHTETLDSCFNLLRSHQQCYTVISTHDIRKQ